MTLIAICLVFLLLALVSVLLISPTHGRWMLLHQGGIGMIVILVFGIWFAGM